MTRDQKKAFVLTLRRILGWPKAAQFVADEVIDRSGPEFVLSRLVAKAGHHSVQALLVGAKHPFGRPLTEAEIIAGIPGYSVVGMPVDFQAHRDAMAAPTLREWIREFKIRFTEKGLVCGKEPGPLRATLQQYRSQIEELVRSDTPHSAAGPKGRQP